MDADDLGNPPAFQPRFALKIDTESDNESMTALATPMTGTNLQLTGAVQPTSMRAPSSNRSQQMQTNLHSGSSASGRANSLTISVEEELQGDARLYVRCDADPIVSVCFQICITTILIRLCRSFVIRSTQSGAFQYASECHCCCTAGVCTESLTLTCLT